MSTITEKEFVHLRVQSSYSLLHSTLKTNDIVDLVNIHGMESVCMADSCNMFGALDFALCARKAKVHGIHGVILPLQFAEHKENKYFGDILVIAKDEIGYKNLLRLSSYPYIKNQRHSGGEKEIPYITLEDLFECNESLIMLSGYVYGPIGLALSDSSIAQNLTTHKNPQIYAKELMSSFVEIFGDRFYSEIMRHGLEIEKKYENIILNIAHELKVPTVATNKVLFQNIDMHDAHDVLMCISQGVVKENGKRLRSSNQCYFKSSQEMRQLFHDIPGAIENAIYIGQRCAYMAETKAPMMPKYEIDGLSEEEVLRREARAGLEKRLEVKFQDENQVFSIEEKEKIYNEYMTRLDYELGTICGMQFSGYFLIVSDFIRWSKENGIFVGPGRGSGAGSIVAWSLNITDLDPIYFGLLFERFLNPERVSMPDFDIDFCQERREEVIAYVRQKYGDDCVAHIITLGKLQAKMVIKDVSRVLGLRYEIADKITELVPFNAVNPVTLQQAMDEVDELQHAYQGNGLYNTNEHKELIKEVLDTALILEGLYRNTSVHAAGVVIAGKKLIEEVPLYRDKDSSMNILQYSMKYTELAGFVKFDFLGLQTLTVIAKCIEMLKKRDIHIDMLSINFYDSEVFDMLSKGWGTGVFQFESMGMQDALRKIKPDRVEDLIALGALYRPGPMDNIPTYVECKHGRQDPDYLHPMLKPILEATYGVIIYQEQVIEIAKVMGGYSLGGADLLRRAMGKKVKSEMDAQEQIFITGSVQNGVSEEQARQIFASVAKFAGYGFNKAHAASYGVISYYTAYLKTHFTEEFLVSCMNLDMGDHEQIAIFVSDAKNFDISILPPNINLSEAKFSILQPKCIVFALAGIKNVTVAVGDMIVEERKRKGHFKSVIDFAERMGNKVANKKVLEALIKGGAFDYISPEDLKWLYIKDTTDKQDRKTPSPINKNAMLQSISNIMGHAERYAKDKSTKQASLFDLKKANISDSAPPGVIINAPEFDIFTRCFMEFDMIGMYVSRHPLDIYMPHINKARIVTIRQLKSSLEPGSHKIRIMGIIQAKDSRMSQRGRFIVLTVSDPTDSVDITIFSEAVLKEYDSLLNIKTPAIFDCDAYVDDTNLRLTVSRITSISAFNDIVSNVTQVSVENISELLPIAKQWEKTKKDTATTTETLNQVRNVYKVSSTANSDKYGKFAIKILIE